VVTEEQVERAREARERDGAPSCPRAELRALIRRAVVPRGVGQHWYLNAAGFVVAILLIYFAGLLLGNYLGRQVYGRVER
jgi:hypothetical protein